MEFSRRRFLLVSSAGIGGMAGCSDGEVGNATNTLTPSSGDEQTTPKDGTDSPGTETKTSTPTPESNIFNLGETAVYSEGQNKELAFRPTKAVLRDALISSRTGYISSSVPDQQSFVYLTILITVKNQGSERIRAPRNILFVTDGRQYEPRFTISGPGERYSGYEEVLPGASKEGWVIFEIPAKRTKGRLVVDFATFGDAVEGEWRFNLENVERLNYDYSDNQAGEIITFGTESTQYQFTARGADELRAYEYESSDYTFEEEAGSGKKFVRVTVFGENTGDNQVRIPSMFDMSLLSGSGQYDPTNYLGDNRFEGGEITPGVEREGYVLFEVPESVGSYELQVDLTGDISATWNL